MTCFFRIITCFLQVRKQKRHPGLFSKININSFYENLPNIFLEISGLSFSKHIFSKFAGTV